MAHLLYIHGFLSSPASHKAVQVERWLTEHQPDIEYHCPFLTVYPEQTRLTLESLVEKLLPEPVYLKGSSLGGYWATWLVEKYGLRAVLINPAVRLDMFKSEYINIELKNYHSNDTYLLTEQHIEQLIAVDINEIQYHNNYWLMVQTGDETLDYRLAMQKYASCKQLIERGGDHSFQNFDQRISDAIEFLQYE
jgi:predicted esterase YcpF (UPF0227 family)